MMIQRHNGVVVDAAELRQGFAKLLREEDEVQQGEGGAKTQGAAALPFALLYIGPQGGRRPWEMQSPKGAAARGVECPPRQVGRAPHLGFPTLGAGGPKWGAHQPTRGWFPSHFSPRGPPG